MAVYFKLPLTIERHAETAAHGGRIKSRVIAQRPHGATEKFTAGIRIRIGALHQAHASGIDRVFVITICEIQLIADRLDLECRDDQERGSERDLADHQHASDRINEPAAVAATALFHNLGRIALCDY